MSQYFISYIKDSDGKIIDCKTGEVSMTLPKYAVWDTSGRKSEVIECSDDLDALLKKYGTITPVYELSKGTATRVS